VLLDALERHRDTDHVFAKRLTVEDLAGRIAFRQAVPPPDPQTVVKGKLKRFLSFSGLVEVVYEAGKPNDLEARPDGSLLFPVRFRGPYTLTIKGDSYADEPKEVPLVQVGMDAQGRAKRDDAWVELSACRRSRRADRRRVVLPRILRVAGGEKTVVAEKTDAHPAQARRPFRLEAAMTATRLTASVNGTTIGGTAKPEGVFGYALILVPGWREITIAGQIEPSWIQGKLDAIVDAKRQAFDAGFDVKTVLPAWLYAPRASAATPAPGREHAGGSITSLPPELMLPYAEALEKLDDDPKAALAAAEALRARAEAEARRARARRARPADEGPGGGGQGPGGDAGRVRRAAVARGPARAPRPRHRPDPDAADAAQAPGGGHDDLGRRGSIPPPGRPPRRGPPARGGRRAARRALGGARAARPDRRARAGGPGLAAGVRVQVEQLPRRVRHRPGHVPQGRAGPRGRARGFRGHVRSLKPEPRRLYRVYLFSGRASFQSYVEDAVTFGGTTPEQVAGLYSPVLKQLLIWNLPDRDEMMKTVRHEGFHQYLDRVLPDPPVWFNEGLAVYFEDLKRVDGVLQAAAVRPDFLRILAGKPLVPMAEFVRIRPADFYRTSPHSYAQGWLVAHLLRQGTPKHKELYRTLLSRLETAAGTEAVEATFDDATLKALDADLKAHHDALKAK
jgi:hypothetical protein